MDNSLSLKIHKCTICKAHLPLKPKPIFQFAKEAKIIIIGQAPGKRTHESGIPWDDKSGERLREWLGVSETQFYNPNLFALVPMGFCYPGTTKNGDLSPRPECAEAWMKPIRNYLTNIKLEILVGKYACDYHFDEYTNLTTLIKSQPRLGSNQIVIPHPSPRNNIWLKKNPWFTKVILKELQKRILREIR